MPPEWAEAVYEAVKGVPSGRVVTYGQVAEMVESVRLTARQAGHAMRFAPPDVPWQRVVGAGGRLPISKRDPNLARRQRQLLEQEGVTFTEAGTVDMERYGWVSSGQGSLFFDTDAHG
ncbi:MAG: MGMT family protein [Armatimonadetes bacterium]|nr:MGMT family protein [Armatimonadota bacterium]